MKKYLYLLLMGTGCSFAQDTIIKTQPIEVKIDQGIEVEEKDTPFAVIETIPLFPNCITLPVDEQRECFQIELNKHIVKNFNYPSQAMEAQIQGRVMMAFTINKDGAIVNLRSTGNANQILKNEGLRIFKLLPKLQPGTQKGKPVNVSYMMPLVFKLE
jgi:protein TonB